jgi:predicted ribosome quality control (RQC) complex YloA/Tae2 family protein
MTPVDSLLGARIQRIDAPFAELFTITLIAPRYKRTLVVSLRVGAPGVGLVTERPKGAAASSFVQKLRKELGGARLAALQRSHAALLELRATRADGEKTLRFEPGTTANVVLLDARGQLLASLHRPAHTPAPVLQAQACASEPWHESLEALEAVGEALLGRLSSASLESGRAALLRSLATTHKRASRRLQAIEGDAARAQQASALRARATLLLANLHAIARGASNVRLQDFTRDPPDWVDITLDPALGAQAQAEAWFQRARRFERGARLAAERLAQTRVELSQIDQLQAAVVAAREAEELQTLQADARKLGARGLETAADGGKAKRKSTRKPYRELRGFQDRAILVGKGAADNDTLTLAHARPHDLWLHARDVTGAHVVVPLSRGESCPPELLLDAAHLAAHFSESRGEPLVDVTHAERRHIRKAKASAPGSVQVEKEKVLRLRVDPLRLKQLLSTELPPD